VSRPCLATKPGWPTPASPPRASDARASDPRHLVQQRDREVLRLGVGERQERLGPLHARDLEDVGQQQIPQVGVVAHAQPDQQVKAAGDHAHVLGLGQFADGPDDPAQLHPESGRHRQVDHDRAAERGPVDVGPVAADRAGPLQPGQPVGDRRRRHAHRPAQGALGLPRVHRQRPQQREVQVVDLDLRGRRGGDLGQPGERR
jgi:hypothetical protein